MVVEYKLVRIELRIDIDAGCSVGGFACRPPVEWVSR